MIECGPSGAVTNTACNRNKIPAASGLRQEARLRETGLTAVVGGIEDGGAGFGSVGRPAGDAIEILVLEQTDTVVIPIATEGAVLEAGRANACLHVVHRAQRIGVPGQIQPKGINRVLTNLLPGANSRAITSGKVGRIGNVKVQKRIRIA